MSNSPSQDSSLICLAIMDNNIEEVKRLLAEGHDPNLKYMNTYPLFCAVRCGNQDIINLLLDQPTIDRNIVNSFNNDLLRHAVIHKNQPLIKRILDEGFEINDQQHIILWLAEQECFWLINDLIDRGVKTNHKSLHHILYGGNEDGVLFEKMVKALETPLNNLKLFRLLQHLVEDGWVNCIDVLERHYPVIIRKVINYKDEDLFGQTLIHKTLNIEVVNKLLQLGADPNMVDNEGDSLLHQACYSDKSEEVVRALLDAGADKTLLNKQNQTAEMIANNEDNFNIVEILRTHVNMELKEPDVE